MDKSPNQILLEAFTEECIEEISRMKHPELTDIFNFGLASADAAVKRVKTKWINKLEDEDNNKIF